MVLTLPVPDLLDSNYDRFTHRLRLLFCTLVTLFMEKCMGFHALPFPSPLISTRSHRLRVSKFVGYFTQFHPIRASNFTNLYGFSRILPLARSLRRSSAYPLANFVERSHYGLSAALGSPLFTDVKCH